MYLLNARQIVSSFCLSVNTKTFLIFLLVSMSNIENLKLKKGKSENVQRQSRLRTEEEEGHMHLTESKDTDITEERHHRGPSS